jgi:UDP-galactopyranose mutase
MPKEGYSKLISNMLTHKNITIIFNTSLNNFNTTNFDLIIYTGGFENLPYRSTHFEYKIQNKNDYAVVNTPQHPSETRYTNFSVLHPINGIPCNNNHLYCYETPLNINEENQLYPINNIENNNFYLKKKNELIKKYNIPIIFLGRLATYQYLDMDKVIEQVIANVKNII